MKKGWAILIVTLIGAALAACGGKSGGGGNDHRYQTCDEDGCYGISGSTGHGYGYVGAGKWTGSIVVTDVNDFGLMMQALGQGMGMRYDYAKMQIKLVSGELPDSTVVAFQPRSSAWRGGTIWLPGTAYAIAGGERGFNIVHTLNNGYSIYPYQHAAKVQKIEIVTRFQGDLNRRLYVTLRYAGKTVGKGVLRGRSEYVDAVGERRHRTRVTKNKKITRRYVTDEDIDLIDGEDDDRK